MRSPLIIAAKKEYPVENIVKIIDILLEHHADPNKLLLPVTDKQPAKTIVGMDDDGNDEVVDTPWYVPLMFDACSQEDGLVILQMLREYGADFNQPDTQGNRRLFNWVLRRFTSFSIKGREDRVTPNDLQKAQNIFLKELKMIDFLLENHADPSLADKDNGKAALHIVAGLDLSMIPDAYQTLISNLIMKGADLEARNNDGRTPLHIAASNALLDLVRILIANGANINALDSKQNTPLHLAAAAGAPRTTQLILETGKANINALNADGFTPLGYAEIACINDKKAYQFSSMEAECKFEAPYHSRYSKYYVLPGQY
ncbi:ankyrin repeat domain-containing protein [Rickettsiales endosymbiont of Stachyamoeba lipophora]|uniref:ankyrin repeat domain-containing protein n=1 Tax=Rickettsiales endosymbiont of Stachyamoeba lipophora TaxID=2486578 RepID=UPI000F6493BC|nr:ankyrin repeat domain-containing protein [Rickettsiales endosymbiont of Stachyamoeba lipophora]AZL16361.1 ankyrin repeat domain-containing protein [Rickettsiales endosymbiont of Stachyamoeba lipophora]